MQTRCYSICRACAAVIPEGRRCPACHGDRDAAAAIAAASAHAVEAGRMTPSRPMRGGAILVTSVVAASLLAGLGMLALAGAA